MENKCLWEHNGNDSLLWSISYPGAFTRGRSLSEALSQMPREVESYCSWSGIPHVQTPATVSEEKTSGLHIFDADSDCIFKNECDPLSVEEYHYLRDLSLKSAADFYALYRAIPGRDTTDIPMRSTFYGQVPRTAEEMYRHTTNVNSYYFGEIGVDVDNSGTIFECRKRGFEVLEKSPSFLENALLEGCYGEMWSLRKVLRRFIWHDRIHAKAMWKMALRCFPGENIPDPFFFGQKTPG